VSTLQPDVLALYLYDAVTIAMSIANDFALSGRDINNGTALALYAAQKVFVGMLYSYILCVEQQHCSL
jgi:hypothetical protein